MGDGGADAFASTIAVNATLTDLNLARNGIGGSMIAVAQAIAWNPVLTALDVSGNNASVSFSTALLQYALMRACVRVGLGGEKGGRGGCEVKGPRLGRFSLYVFRPLCGLPLRRCGSVAQHQYEPSRRC